MTGKIRAAIVAVLLMMAASTVTTSASFHPQPIEYLLLHGGQYQTQYPFGPDDPLAREAETAGQHMLPKPRHTLFSTVGPESPRRWQIGGCHAGHGITIRVFEQNTNLGLYRVQSFHQMSGC